MIKPIYHPYWLWEETKYNMWGKVEDRETFLQKAIKFTGDYLLYGSWMKKVILSWKFSCEHNLSQLNQNRRAWLGHAACAFAFKCPEDIVREAWWNLTQEQRDLADEQAEKYIFEWEILHCQKDQLILPF